MAEVNTDTPANKYPVNLPKTDFPMRGNLPQTEPDRVRSWQSNGLYEKMIERRKGQKKFVMPDGPPYANGSIHIGHVLNKVLKDIVIKYKSLRGFHAEFIPGWDCHGLPIELKVTQALGDKKASLSKKEIRDLCRAEAAKWIDHQREQFRRLGILGAWERPYRTMDPAYEAEEVRVLSQIHKNGLLYRGEKPVYWCPALQTALAAAEVEYHDHKSPSIYVRFQLLSNDGPLRSLKESVSLVIWTTTPWTLPANVAIAVNSDFDYGVFKTEAHGLLIVATELAASVSKEIGLDLGAPVLTFKGTELEGLKAQHPFMPGRESLVVLGDHVSLEAGTGAVHTAPGHGLEDYAVGLRYKLPILSPVGPDGVYTKDAGPYQGLHIWKANKIIVEDLKTSGHLLAHKDFVHSYPHNPRSKTPLIFRATPQWFVRMDGETALRQRTLSATESQIRFVPDWGRPRLQAMVQNTPDWCLSRQRTWGVPIPVFFCENCETPLADSTVMENVANIMAETGLGIEAYFDTPVEKLTLGKSCSNCGQKKFRRSEDILDVWFDSGVCHTAVQKKESGLDFPADIYLEGSDQHRGWFQTSLISSMAAYGTPPFKALITHGFVNDAQGHKMSKSKGNVVDPAQVTSKYGAEILRLWVTYEDYGQDVSVSDEMFQRVSETYRRIRNTMRFLLGNLGDYDFDRDQVAFADMPLVDRWALGRLNRLIENCTKAYDEYDFFKVYHALNNFFTVDLSALYLDVLKDRLYTGRSDGSARRASQTVFYLMLHRLCGLMAPVLSFLAEETYHYIPGTKAESIFLTDFPTVEPKWQDSAAAETVEALQKWREKAQVLLEGLRTAKTIGSSLDASLTLTAEGSALELLQNLAPSDLREFFIVSTVRVKKGPENVEAVKATGEKCPRCWHYSDEIGINKSHPTICPKCIGNIG
jgi:isoleucyl-tRNA synthetase